MSVHVDGVLDEIRQAGGTLRHEDLDRYRHRYAGGAALVLGMIEVARMLMVQEILVNAAREGARTAVAPLKTDMQVNQIVDSHLRNRKDIRRS